MATLHLMVGLPCSGKSTRARALGEEFNALVLTPDLWQLKLFGDDAGDPAHDARHTAVEEIMWDVAERVLAMGGSVVLDFGFWSREERDDFRARARRLGVGFRLHFMDVPVPELFARMEARNRVRDGRTFFIPREEMEKYIPLSSRCIRTSAMRKRLSGPEWRNDGESVSRCGKNRKPVHDFAFSRLTRAHRLDIMNIRISGRWRGHGLAAGGGEDSII